MAQPLIKFFRVAELPAGAGVPGALYFVHDSSLGEGKGKLYICTAIGVFEDYTGLHSYENTNTTYDLKSVVNELKGQIQLVGSDETVDNLYIEGGDNIKVSSTADGVKVEHTTPTEGTALEAEATEKTPGYAGTFTAVTGLKKDANGHIVEATLETIKLPAESADVDSLDGKTGVITTLKNQETIGAINLEVDANNQLKATLVGSFENGAQVNKVEGVTLNGTDVVGEDKIARITAIEGIVENDKVLSKSGNNIMSTLSLDYETQGDKKYIVLKGIDGVEIDKIDASDFVADSFLNDVEIKQVDGKDILYFTWAMADGTTKTDSVDLSKYINIYTGAENQIVVSESNVIGLAEHKAEAATGKALTPAHGGSFNVITGVTTDDYGRVNSVETSQVTLPTIADGNETGADEYVSVQVKTTAGAVSEVIVNTDALSTKISGIEADLTEVAQVTAAALVDLDSRLDSVEAGTITSVTGEANELNNTAYVNVKATTENGAVTLASSVKAVEATDATKYPSTGLATDGYVNEKVATVAATAGTAVQNIDSEAATIQVTRAEGSNDVNLELAWAAFE